METKTIKALSIQKKNLIENYINSGVYSDIDTLKVYSTVITNVLMETANFSTMSIMRKDIFKAALNPRIKDLTYDYLIPKLTELVLWVHAQVGWKVEAKIINATIDDFCFTLQKYHTTLTLEEIKIAFYNGYNKVYGDWITLSNATYNNWLREYTFSDDRANAIIGIAEAKKFIVSPPVKKVTPEEENEMLKIGAISKWNEAKAGKEVSDVGNVTYDFLNGLKLIQFSPTRKNEMMEMIKQELIDELKSQLLVVTEETKIHHNVIKAQIEELRKGKPSPTEKKPNAMAPHPKVIINTKKLALQIYFHETLQSGTDFIQLLDTAYNEWKNKM